MSKGFIPPGAAGFAAFQAPLLAVMREALRNAGGRVVLRVPAMAPHRRRVAQALLQEGALAAGGVVAEGPNDDLLLIGAEAGRAERLRGLLDRLIGGQVTGLWSLEREAASMLDYAASAEALALGPEGAGPALAALDTWLRTLPLERVVQRNIGMRLDANGEARPAFLRLSIARQPLADLLGGLGTDIDMLEHASRALAARLLLTIGDPLQRRGLMGAVLPGPLHLPVPPAPINGRGENGGGGRRGGLVATMGPEMMADPVILAARQASLAAQGWALELDGLDASALRVLAIEALPADWLRIIWSPGLATPAVVEALSRVDPARIILAGVDGPAALGWARRLGVRLLEGRAVEVAAIAPPLPIAVPAVVKRPVTAAPARPAA